MWLYINIYEQLTLQLFWNTNTITWNYTMRNRNFNEVVKKSILLKLKAFKSRLTLTFEKRACKPRARL